MDRFRQVATAGRGGLSESWHFGAAAVVESEGRLVARVGSESVETFVRSAAKPFQALPLVLAGGVERWSLSQPDLALICASHRGTPAHTERVRSLLDRGGLAVDDLGCGPHWPFDDASCVALRRRGSEPTRLHNNCSGKHAGMLLACRMLGYPIEDYLSSRHPLQERILDLVAAHCGVDPDDVGLGVDGCGAPSFRLSLESLARGYAVLADPHAADISSELATALSTIASAMTGAPEMVAGPGAFTTRLMQVTGGRLLGKEGAEGLYGVAVRGPVTLGVAVKIADGADRPRAAVVIDILRQMGVLSSSETEALRSFHRPLIRNAIGDAVGEVISDVELDAV